jgi:hypothetical protein
VFDDDDSEQNGDQQQQHEDAFDGARFLGVLIGDAQLFDAGLDLLHGLFDVVIDAVENCALLDHEHTQLSENGGQFIDALCDVNDLLLTLTAKHTTAMDAKSRLEEGQA